MILIGTTDLRRTRDRGDFRCPQCRQQRPYRLRSVRPFLTLYFIPTIPIGAVQHYVQCEYCSEVFDPAVLEIDTETAMRLEHEQYCHEVMNAAVLTVVADGEISEAEIESIGQISHYLFGHEADREDVGRLCASATQVGFKPHTYLQSVVMRWDKEQKYEAMKVIFAVTSADGDLTDDQLQALVAVRRTLGLSQEDFESAVEEAVALANEYDR